MQIVLHRKVVLSAVSLAVFLMEALVAELFATLCAEEMVDVPRAFKRSDAFLQSECYSSCNSHNNHRTSLMAPLQ